MNAEIESLIPHRYPFLFVDELLEASEIQIVGLKTFDKNEDSMLTGSFPQYDFIPGMIIVESMAQCGGAGIKKAGLADGFFGLIGMDKVRFYKGAKYGETLKYVIENIRVSNRIIRQTGIAYIQEMRIAKATWTCARID